MKNSSDTIGNRTRNLPAYRAVNQPTAPPRAPQHGQVVVLYRLQQLGAKIKQTRPAVSNYVGLEMRHHLISVFESD
jgi:hypothetical protein